MTIIEDARWLDRAKVASFCFQKLFIDWEENGAGRFRVPVWLRAGQSVLEGMVVNSLDTNIVEILIFTLDISIQALHRVLN